MTQPRSPKNTLLEPTAEKRGAQQQTVLQMQDSTMTGRERELTAIARIRHKAIAGDLIAVSNVAAGYRILDRWDHAFRWWKKGAAAGNGSNKLEVGYCYHHGLGVRRDLVAARRCYESAIRSFTISQFEQEEAMYNLAVLLLHSRRPALRARVEELLRDANLDGDYPQAANLLARISHRYLGTMFLAADYADFVDWAPNIL